MAIISASLAIAARSALPRRRTLLYISKPLTTVLILMVVVVGGPQPWSLYRGAILLGLVFSIAGDILLMLPTDHFAAGLFSFLLGLLSYAYAFARTSAPRGFPWPAVPLALVGALTLVYLWPGLKTKLRGPVIAYVVAMVAMASLGSYRAVAAPSTGAMAGAIGATLFLASDAMLAINAFRQPIRGASVLILSTYYVGQLLIALSAVLPLAPII